MRQRSAHPGGAGSSGIASKSGSKEGNKDGNDGKGGNYTVTSSGNISMTDTSIGSTTSMTVSAAGQTFTQTVEPEPSIFSQGGFACSGDRLEITVDGFTAVMHREP